MKQLFINVRQQILTRTEELADSNNELQPNTFMNKIYSRTNVLSTSDKNE